MPVTAYCPDPERLRQLLLGRVSEQAAVELEQHLENCEHCGRLLPSLEVDDALVADMRAGQTVALEPADLNTIQMLLPRLHALGATLGAGGTAAGSTELYGDGKNGQPGGHGSALTELLRPPQTADELGWLGSYRVIELLGAGGMGLVFRAEDVQLQRPVALKVMRPELARHAAAKERFLREARATAALEHDHIVTVYQVGEDRGVAFLAMQLLKGLSLQDQLDVMASGASPPLTLGRVLRMAREIAAGLSVAHQRGLIHRDIKPSNIWLDEVVDGRVKLLDFGLALAAEDESQLTRFGTIIGSPAYMAPEQARHAAVDARTDLFSLGCVLYRLVTGRLPWIGKDALGTLVAIATEEPIPPSAANPLLPAPVGTLVAHLLARRPEERPESAASVAARIEQIEHELAPEALSLELPGSATAGSAPSVRPAGESPGRAAGTAQRPPGRRRRWGMIGACGALPLLVLAAVIYVHTDSGVLEIDTAGDEVRVIVEQDGKRVQVVDAEGDTHLTLPAGDYKLRLEPARTGIKLSNDQVQIRRGSQALVRVDPEQDHRIVDTSKLASEYRNSIGMRLMLIPAGEFVMGSPLAEVGRVADEQPHRVVITRPFYMGACDVTIGQFQQFVESTSYVADGGNDWKSAPSTLSDDFPVGNVSWNDAVAFCDWLSKKESSRYRLPTEAEWEYACRAGTKTTRFCGDDLRVVPQYAWCHEDSQNVVHPVGRLKPNPWGLYDMLGNVWQWTTDFYSADYYLTSPVEDPPGPSTGTNRVMRGGTFAIAAKELRAAWRHGFHDASWHRRHVGFRVVLTEPPVTATSR